MGGSFLWCARRRHPNGISATRLLTAEGQSPLDDAMNKIVQGLIVFVGVALLFLGIIFVIAGGLENTAIGGVMVLIAVVLFVLVYRMMKIEAAKPTLVSQTFNVKMEGSGEFKEKELKCKSCGAPLSDKNLSVIEGGIMAKCPYCGVVYALQEQPKW